MKPRLTLLLHPLFILSIFLLLLNDFCLKYEYHNWLTGKLSDFAGLFAFSVFWFTVFPKYKKEIIIAIALFFIWWKSALSNSFIHFCNEDLLVPVHRVVDPSDIYAIAVLPFSFLIKPVKYAGTAMKKLAVGCVGIISFTAFTATSLPRRLADDNKVLLDKNSKTKKKENEVIKSLENHGLGPIKKEPVFERAWNDTYYLRSRTNDSIVIPADSLYKGIYTRIDFDGGYTIPKLHVADDSVYNLQFIISEYDHGKTHLRLYSFEYKNTGNDSAYFNSYYIWKRFKKPIKKKIKEALKE